MPLTQPRRHNPLMTRYFDALGLTGAEFARRAGISHSQVYMARNRHVGSRNAARIAAAVARLMPLSADEELALKAEIMGHPEDLVRAYLGSGKEAAETLGEEPSIGIALVGGEEISNKAGRRVLAALEAMRAPQEVVSRVRAQVKPPPSPPGKITYTTGGRPSKAEERQRLREAKPRTAAAVEASGLSRREIYERAGVGKETLREAFYARCGERSSSSIARALAGEAGLTNSERQTLVAELQTAPEKISKNSSEKVSESR